MCLLSTDYSLVLLLPGIRQIYPEVGRYIRSPNDVIYITRDASIYNIYVKESSWETGVRHICYLLTVCTYVN